MLPYLQKLANAYKETGKLIVWGVSQDDSATTSAFVQQQGIEFPVCLDRESYHSTLLGVVTVPTVFLVNGAGEVVRKIAAGTGAR
jgi:peroxiredoxin